MGEYDKRTESDGPHQDIKIADYETHSDHDDFIKINDIAMIYLEHDVEFTGENSFLNTILVIITLLLLLFL